MIPSEFPYGAARLIDDALFDEISRNIRTHGVQLIAVYDVADDDYLPFLYTIGLQERGLPELIAFGDSERMLNAVADLFYRIAREAPENFDPKAPMHYKGGTLVAANPDPEFDAFLQAHCLIEAKDYYHSDRVEVLVVLPENHLERRSPRLH